MRVFALLPLLAACPAPRAPVGPRPLPADATAHYLAARLAQAQGENATAIRELRAALAAAPDQALIEVALIDVLAVGGELDDARAEVEHAETRWPDAPDVWLAAGRVYAGLDKTEPSRLAFQHALHLDPTLEAAWLGVGAAWETEGQAARAENTYQQLLAAVPDSIDGEFQLASRMLDRGDDQDAEPHLRHVLEEDPDQIDARLALARSLRRAGKLADAITETRQAFDRTGGDLDVAEELFWLLCESDDRRAALDLLGLLDDPSQTLQTHLGIASLYRQIGAFDDALRVGDAAHADDPDSTAATLTAAQAHADDGDSAGALALARAIPDDDRHAVAARALEIQLLDAGGKVDDAEDAAEALRKAHPDDAGALAAYADALAAAGRGDEARRALAAAVAAHPGSTALRYALASFEDSAGDPAGAAADAEAIVAARDDDVAALNLAGYALARSGAHLDRAETYLARARALAPGDPAILDSWGWLRFRQGKLDDAAAALAHAVDLSPNNVEIRDHLRQVRAALGQK